MAAFAPPVAHNGPAPSEGAAQRMATAFARLLRGLGLSVPIGCVLTFTEALGALGQAVAALASLGGCVLVYTGFALAWHRWRRWRNPPPLGAS